MSGFSRQPEQRSQTAAHQQIERDLPWLPAPALRYWWRRRVVCPLDDPVRQALNDGFALVMLLVLPVGMVGLLLVAWIEQVSLPELALQLMLVAVVPFTVLLNRRGGVHGTIVAVIISMLMILMLVPVATYIGTAVIVHLIFILPTLIAAVFLSPRAAVPASVAMVATLVGKAWLFDYDSDTILNFLVIAVPDFIIVTAVLMFGSFSLRRALRQSHDLTNRLEQRVAERTAELQQALERVQGLTAARRSAMLHIAHDTANLLQHINAQSEFLRWRLEDEGVCDEALRAQLARLDSAIDSLSMFMADLRDTALLETNALPLRNAPVDLLALTRRVIAELQSGASAGRFEFKLSASEELSPAYCDPRRIIRVLHNVLGNAIKHNQQQGLMQVHITLTADDGHVQWQCTDDGVGIAADALADLQERIQRAAAGELLAEGSGIGLIFSARLIALSRGSFHIDSPGPGKGTTVTLRLPRVT